MNGLEIVPVAGFFGLGYRCGLGVHDDCAASDVLTPVLTPVTTQFSVDTWKTLAFLRRRHLS